MSIYSTTLHTISLYYPLGNTPAVCLTQDLLPEQEAAILLLGCGDARNILFTCFADNSRKIDVTCCDIEPMIHARNVLLYTLLIDDTSNRNIELIWNIYHNWKVDKNSLELLESQIEKLKQISESVDQWHSSIYGSSIRFCDEKSLSSVRCYWLGFTSHGLTPGQKEFWLSQLQAAINRAKASREDFPEQPNGMGYRSTFPCSWSSDAYGDVAKVTKQWWDFGTAPSRNSSVLKSSHLNPVFLYSPNYPLTMHAGVSPLGGIPLSNAYASISKESPFCLKNKNESFAEHLVNCAKSHFTQWASAFRKAVANGSKIRIFSGDACAFCLTLHHCHLTQSTSMNLFCHSLTNSPLILHPSDYGHNNDAAPLNFDVIDTSNLADHLGIVNLVVLASNLLKHYTCSSLYTEILSLYDFSLIDRLSSLFGVDIRCMSLFLRLIPPDLFTNATNSIDEYPSIRHISRSSQVHFSARSRLRWKRFGELQSFSNSPYLHIEAKELAKFLIQVHGAMLETEAFSMLSLTGSTMNQSELQKLHFRPYNRASFAFLLRALKTNIMSDWDECLKEFYNGILRISADAPLTFNFLEDLALYLHVFGVDDSLFIKPHPSDMHILTSILPNCKDLPEQLCVSTRLHREQLGFFKKVHASLTIVCSFETRDLHGKRCIKSFSSVQVVFGKWHDQTKKNYLSPYIEEEFADISSTSNMFVSVMVPTSMLILMLRQSEQFVPLVKCGFKFSLINFKKFSKELGSDLYFSSTELTGKDVFITQFMPSMSGLPLFTFAKNHEDNAAPNAIKVHLSPDGSKINSLIKRITMESNTAKTKLAMKSSTVRVEFKSPFSALICIAGSLEFNLKFPIPVSLSKYKVRIARKSSYVEVESQVFDPLEEDSSAFLFPCFLVKVPCGIVPTPWTSLRVNLDVMPSFDLKDSQELSWLLDYLSEIYSLRETEICMSEKQYDLRVSLKKGLALLFLLYAGSTNCKEEFFELKNVNSPMKILILPSRLRLDFANSTIVLDCALVLLTSSALQDPVVTRFLLELHMNGLYRVEGRNVEILAWKAMIPALVERCRTWKHTSRCEYLMKSETPLRLGLDDNDAWSICSCGVGKFPAEYLSEHMKRVSTLSYILNHYATRVAISPIFSVQYVEDCDSSDADDGRCGNCGSDSRKNAQTNQQSLFKCSRCKVTLYCSTDCQKAHWKKHKPTCKAV